ncbi:hypothetical protein JKP88DRAFT_354015 [Tribonema minus]|uniref:VWFA domain-containing protein n=1 Tax=Tribonema minus TaxID=303371 RepID=A0A835Z291_9STRA|nr:hypothetical protein JKP88DRAFT_354015 [Tribonema minus]
MEFASDFCLLSAVEAQPPSAATSAAAPAPPPPSNSRFSGVSSLGDLKSVLSGGNASLEATAPAGVAAALPAAGTNVVNVDFGTLAEAVPVMDIKPVSCKHCGAFASPLSELSQVTDTAGNTTCSWSCEFCGCTQALQVADMQACPATDGTSSCVVDYVIQAAPPSSTAKDTAGGAVIFAIDTSGSMCVTTEVQGAFKLRGAAADAAASLRGALRGEPLGDQRLPTQQQQQRRGGPVTYISRLQAVQAAVSAQLETMARDTPSARAGLITFSGDITVIGDAAAAAPTVVAGAALHDAHALADLGAACALTRGVGAARAALEARLFALSEGGPTALGPAAALGLAQAIACGAGSRLVVCTDGLANVGVGSLDGGGDAAPAFYEYLAGRAAQHGVIVDVVSIAGGGCDLETLGVMSDLTGGTVTRVDPLSLADNFATMLAEPLIAINVTVTLRAHRSVALRDTARRAVTNASALRSAPDAAAAPSAGAGAAEGGAAAAADALAGAAPASPAGSAAGSAAAAAAAAAIAVGNVTSETEMSFEYDIASDAAAALSAVPFQLAMEYTRPDGARCLRVSTARRPVTRDASAAAAAMHTAVVAAHGVRQSALLAREGQYAQSRAALRTWQGVVEDGLARGCDAADADRVRQRFQADAGALHAALGTAQAMEAAAGMAVEADEEGGGGGAAVAARRKNARRADDGLSITYSCKKASSKGYKG